ncbi:MAG: hypothetical protein J7J22_04960 [Candidatus Verstraetearchaeota archaeon]|nr:hypothetical protein [Candidatus Verstraetearchaeota archaeon]
MRRERRIWDKYLKKFTSRLEGRLLEPLKKIIIEKEAETISQIFGKLETAGIIGEDFRKMLVDIMAYTIFDRFYWKLRSLDEDPVAEFKRFKSTITNIDDYLDGDLIYYALKDECKDMGKINRVTIERIISTLNYTAEIVKRIRRPTLIEVAKNFRSYVMFNVSKDMPEKLYVRKAGYFGLLTSTLIRDVESALESLRLSIIALPFGEQQVANNYLYILGKILKIWNIKVESNLKPALEPGIAEVLLSLGLTDKKLENMDYTSAQYLAYLRIAETLFPEDPTKIMVLRRVAEEWCYAGEWKRCGECWLNSSCPKEY